MDRRIVQRVDEMNIFLEGRYCTTMRRIETRIFRVDTEVAEQLDELAQKDKISVNVIANQALRKHVEYDSYAEKFGLVTISKGLLKRFFSLMSDEQARSLGRKSGEHEGVALVIFWFKDFNLENVIKIVGSGSLALQPQFRIRVHA